MKEIHDVIKTKQKQTKAKIVSYGNHYKPTHTKLTLFDVYIFVSF